MGQMCTQMDVSSAFERWGDDCAWAMVRGVSAAMSRMSGTANPISKGTKPGWESRQSVITRVVVEIPSCQHDHVKFVAKERLSGFHHRP